MQPFTLRRLILFALVVLLLPACGDSADEGAATTVSTTTTATPETTIPTVEVIEIVEVSGSTGLVTGQEGDTTIFDDLSSSDDRLVGTSELTIECDRSEDGGTTIAECAGPMILTNDGGTWEGTCEGTSTWTTSEPAHVHVFDCTYLGTGDYQGLRFVQHLEGIGYPWPYTGRIEPVD